jgi:hypothetical protein
LVVKILFAFEVEGKVEVEVEVDMFVDSVPESSLVLV